MLEIARAVARALDRSWEKVLIPGPPVEGVGETPWSTPFPFVLDLSLAERELGYRPVAGYADSVAASCAWLIEATRGRDWREVLPQTARLIGDLFDYSSEDTMIDRISPIDQSSISPGCSSCHSAKLHFPLRGWR